MSKTRDNKGFWNLYAKLYDFEIMRFSGKAYQEMYRMMARVLSPDMVALEVATGTGLIAVNVAAHVRHMEAVDFAPNMIARAKKKIALDNLRFSVEDATALSFEDNAFDAVIISNALHVMPDPAGVLSEISRVLKPSGLLIAPSYSHGHIKDSTWRLNARVLRLFGCETYAKWSPETYVDFISQNDFEVKHWQVLRAAFPLVYLEAHKTGER